MSEVERLESEVRGLTQDDLAKFRAWFLELEEEAWDRQIEADARGGRLDWLKEEARADFETGNSREL